MFRLNLKECRVKAGFKTQSEAADALGMKKRRYASLERGEVQVTLEDTYMICGVFSCTPNDLCGWYIDHPEDRPTPPGHEDPEASELVRAYRSCTPERKESLLNLARDSALLSGFDAERRQAQEAV
jgi:DNA-binding XRE family transcriptional regulator